MVVLIVFNILSGYPTRMSIYLVKRRKKKGVTRGGVKSGAYARFYLFLAQLGKADPPPPFTPIPVGM
jgi:hypothetical protein